MTEVHVHGAHATVRAPGLEDEVAVEEPLEIRVDGRPLVVTMRTPGHDEELALGFLYGEGLIDGLRAAGPPADLAANTVEVSGPLTRDPTARNFFTSSSCGVCGKGALEEVAVVSEPVPDGPVFDRANWLAGLPDLLRQPTFERTGGLHATGLFTPELACVREDVGRHNAMDKVVGWALGQGLRAAVAARAVRVRPPVVRAGAEGGGGGGAGAGRRRRADLAGRPARGRPQHDPVRLRPRRPRQRLHGSGAGAMTFDAVVQTEDEGVFVEVPADSEFAQARAPVNVTINGQTWESSVADYGGRFYLPLRRGIRQLAGIEPGDTVSVTLEPR